MRRGKATPQTSDTSDVDEPPVTRPASPIDRALQRRLLEKLANAYPASLNQEELFVWALTDGCGGKALMANLAYLREHGLVTAEIVEFGATVTVEWASITARGLDFLADDGGLTAILGVVTVKLHDETIRKILLERIEAAPGDPTAKQRLRDAVRSLPADGLKEVALHGLKAGLEQVPNPLPFLEHLLGLG